MSEHTPNEPKMKSPLVTPLPKDEPADAVAPTPPDEPAVAVTPTPPDEPAAVLTLTPSDEPAAKVTPTPLDEPAAAVASVSDSATGPDKDQMLAEFWETVKRLPNYVRLATLMARDPRVPKSSKALLAAGTAYTVTPIDFVPGIIPVAGQLDDLYVLLSALRQAIRTCPDEVVQKHLAATGVTPERIDADLALVRKMVRRGVAWTIRNGGKALAGATRYVSARLRERRSSASGSGGS